MATKPNRSPKKQALCIETSPYPSTRLSRAQARLGYQDLLVLRGEFPILTPAQFAT